MPKERKDRSLSTDKLRANPYRCSTSHPNRPSNKNPLESEENLKEWEDARCPICMEHPHNAILLLCSSHDIGCRPYMCDTSYRHSNCFDQFKKTLLISESQPSATISEPLSGPNGEKMKSKLSCPLCRGEVNGWVVVDAARLFMNTKTRSCASETCDFTGTYTDLRKHARLVHPFVRPSEADPERQRDWHRMERQRDLGDLLSTLQSAIGEERDEDGTSGLSVNQGRWLTFFFVRVIRHGNGLTRSVGSRARAQVPIRRRARTRLWGESYDGQSRDGDDNNEPSDDGSRSASDLFEEFRRRQDES